ncbi:putative IQ motif, EF-hand binding protein [Helianthus debilis subsp. tardiflorus]
MGKTSRFFKSLFGWSFFKSHRDNHAKVQPRHHRSSGQTTDGSSSANHAIAVAAADDAVAAAHAAAEVVRLTNRTAVVGSVYGVGGEWAAVKIQSYYRGYLVIV